MTFLGLYGAIFYNNILPIFLTAGAGFAVGRAFRPDIRAVSRLLFYVFSPSLVFSSILRSELSGGEFGQMAFFTLATILLMAGIAYLTGAALRLEQHMLATLVIASVFVNGGNYGLALVQFAYGDEALARAVIYFVFSTLAVYTLGVGLASLGRRPLRDVLKHALTLPTTYALAGGLLLRATGWGLPLPLSRAVTLLGQAAVPLMLVLLGLQMAEVRAWPHSRLALISLATFMQLVVSPVLGLVMAGLLGMTGPTRQAAVTETAMPTAVITTILAVEYDLDPALVSSTVILTTLLSPVVLTPLIAYLQLHP